MTGHTGPLITDVLDRERMIDALLAEWLKHADAKTSDSPRGHCERLADALIAASQRVPDGEA